jgi:hypothetical protein
VTSQFGYYFDYAVGGLSYGALFAGLGIGLAQGPLGGWALLLGAAGTAAAPLAWLGFLTPFFVAAGIGTAVYCLWTLGRVVAVRLRARL